MHIHSYSLDVNCGMFEEHLHLTACVDRPRVQFSVATIDFGTIMRGFVYSRQLKIVNQSKEKVLWYVDENIFNLDTGEFGKIDHNFLKPHYGVLYGNEDAVLEYIPGTEVRNF